MATACVVALIASAAVSSCVNADYELSEEKINTDVTVFQEGLTLPIGKTAPITMEELFNMLDPETQAMIKGENGYGVYYSGAYDLSDSLKAYKDMLKIEKYAVEESFSFNLSNVNLDGVEFKRQTISPAAVNISSMLDIPEIGLPKVGQSMSLSADTPDLGPGALNLDFESLNMRHPMEFASLGGAVNIGEEYMQFIDWADEELTYRDLQDKITETNSKLAVIPGASQLPALPALTLATGIDPFEVTVPIEIELPSQIKSVKSIQLHENANVDLDIKIENPLFKSGAIVPHLDIDLHNLFHIHHLADNGSGSLDNVTVPDEDGNGTHLEQHIRDNFRLDAAHGWDADHVYYVDSLSLKPGDWKRVGDKLVLKKDIKVKVEGEIEDDNLKTTLNWLREHTGDPMKVIMTLKFNDFVIDNVKMEINPITIEQPVEMPISVSNITLPEIVEKVEYIALDSSEPLNLKMNANVPDAYKGLDLKLETLDITFPEGLQVNHERFNEKDRKLSYSNISLTEGLNDQVRIDRIILPDPDENNMLSYDGTVSVVAKAVASGIINSADLLGGKGGKMSVDVNVDYQPVLDDYSVVINDYPYEVKIDPKPIDQKLPAEVGKMNEITVYLENDPEIKISLDYPSAGGKISIIPHREKGLKMSFPEMIRFKNLKPEYNYDQVTNSISFTGSQSIPREIVLPIDYLAIRPELVAGKEDEYCVKGEVKVEGGVCLEGMTVNKGIIDDLKNENASISFKAEIPNLKPAKLAVDQYVANIKDTIDFSGIKFDGLPDIIQSVDELSLKDVYLNLEVDASSVANVVKDVDMTLDFDIKLPELIKVENAGSNNVLKIEGKLNDENKIVLAPVHVIGLDLDGVDFSAETIDLGEQHIEISGNVKLENVSVDINAIGKEDLVVSVNGSLCTKGSEYIELGRVEAHVDYQLEPVSETVSIASLVEGLGEKIDFSLDFNRVHLDVDLATNLTLPVALHELSLVPFHGGEAGEPMSMEPFALKYSDNGDVVHTKLRISNKEEADDKHSDPEYEHITLDILSLIKDMPDSLQLRLRAGTQDNAVLVLDPSFDYVLKADYALEMPLELGDDFRLEFADTLKGLPPVLGEALSYGSVALAGEITNSFPIQLELEFQLLDVDGNVVPLAEGSGSQIIKGCNLDGSPNKTELNVLLGVAKGVEIPQLDALKMNFKATSAGISGIKFSDDCFIQAELRVDIPEGVSVNIKDFMKPQPKSDNQ